MSWVDLVLNSDAAKLNPTRARELVREAGGVVPEELEAVGDDSGNQGLSSPESVVTSSTASPTATATD